MQSPQQIDSLKQFPEQSNTGEEINPQQSITGILQNPIDENNLINFLIKQNLEKILNFQLGKNFINVNKQVENKKEKEFEKKKNNEIDNKNKKKFKKIILKMKKISLEEIEENLYIDEFYKLYNIINPEKEKKWYSYFPKILNKLYKKKLINKFKNEKRKKVKKVKSANQTDLLVFKNNLERLLAFKNSEENKKVYDVITEILISYTLNRNIVFKTVLFFFLIF